MYSYLLATEETYGIAKIAEFYEKGGVIMYALTLCSIVTLAVIIFKALSLKKNNVLPATMQQTIAHFTQNQSDSAADQLAIESRKADSVLARFESSRSAA